MKKTFLFLAEGFEELEAIAVADVFLRGGVKCKPFHWLKVYR